MDTTEEYYVYVYIDPRNFEEFYYGKGKGNRKDAHLKDEGDSEKTSRINTILKEGLKPIIKVIAKELTERDAFLIEKTLIWKLGRNLTNKSTGHFAEKFRPHDTYHKSLPGFDFRNGVFYVNIAEGPHRCWEDCKKYGFLSAGQDKKWNRQIQTLEIGDIVAAYQKNKGFVGIGRVKGKATPVASFLYDGKSLRDLPLKVANIFENSENLNKCEYLVNIDWIRSVSECDAKWSKKSGLFTSQLVRASLRDQSKTLKFLEKEFDVNFEELMQPRTI
jgi:hypothetical protein